MNLFRVFNPSSWINLNLNWVIFRIIIFARPVKFWINNNKILYLLSMIFSSLKETFSKNVKPIFPLGRFNIYTAVFLRIVLSNILGLLPYVFTPSRHLTINLSLTLPLWIGFIVLTILKSPNLFLAHLVPSGAPTFLQPFIVLIELTSNLIRPITLSIRLTANIMAGHLLITLLANSASVKRFILIFPSLLVLCVLETAVALIQAYVFSILRILYIEESNTVQISYSCSLYKTLSCGLRKVINPIETKHSYLISA